MPRRLAILSSFDGVYMVQGSTPQRRLVVLASRSGDPLAEESALCRLVILVGGGGSPTSKRNAPRRRLAILVGGDEGHILRGSASRRMAMHADGL